MEGIIPIHPLPVVFPLPPDPGVVELGGEVLVDLLGEVEDRAPLLQDYRGAQVRFVARAFGVDPQAVKERKELAAAYRPSRIVAAS